MGSVKRSISLSSELAEVLDDMAEEQGLDRSRLVEILLRENPALHQRIQRKRGLIPRTKRGRSLTELSFLAKAAQRQWEKKEEAGQVKLREPGK